MNKKLETIESLMKILRDRNSGKDDKFFEEMFDRLSDMGEKRLGNYLKIVEKL